MQVWNSSAHLAVAEEDYVAAEMERLDLICRRNRLESDEYWRRLSAAWLRSEVALEALTALRNAEASARLTRAAQELERA